VATAPRADAADAAGVMYKHCPLELNDSLAIVQVTLLLAVGTIFVFGAAARDVALLCGALPQPVDLHDPRGPAECCELTPGELPCEASDAEPEGGGAEPEGARGGTTASALPLSSRWKRLDAQLVLLLTRRKDPLLARSSR
jgi:hypothetical protein